MKIMQLVTAEMADKMPYSLDITDYDAPIVGKFFHPFSNLRLYVVGACPVDEDGYGFKMKGMRPLSKRNMAKNLTLRHPEYGIPKDIYFRCFITNDAQNTYEWGNITMEQLTTLADLPMRLPMERDKSFGVNQYTVRDIINKVTY